MADIRLKMYEGLLADVAYEVSVLANTTAFLMQELDDVSWAGFYLNPSFDSEESLILGPFQGKVACTTIDFGKGVCGTAAAERQTQLVPNVHEFPGHIACDAASNSEIVIPIVIDDIVYGVLDLDSTSFARFTEEDQVFLEALCDILKNKLISLEDIEEENLDV